MQTLLLLLRLLLLPPCRNKTTHAIDESNLCC
jgi:hypothetical protein